MNSRNGERDYPGDLLAKPRRREVLRLKVLEDRERTQHVPGCEVVPSVNGGYVLRRKFAGS